MDKRVSLVLCLGCFALGALALTLSRAWWVWVLLGLLALVAAFMVSLTFGTGRRLWTFMAATEQPIGSVEVGTTTRVRGMVRPLEGATLTAPVTDRPVVAYRVRVRYLHGDSSSGWETAEEEAVDFALDDGTGLARIETVGAELHIEGELDVGAYAHEHRARVSEAPDWMLAFVEKAGLGRLHNTPGDYVVREVAIEPGEDVGAHGVARDGGSAGAIALGSSDEHRLLVTDRPDLLD